MGRRLVYDVAVSLDGFVADARGRVDGFLYEGDHVSAYRDRLTRYDTVLMGRRSYEAGYAFGMEPGAAPYSGMRHFVFSTTLVLPEASPVTVVRAGARQLIEALKAEPGTDIYVCGGGAFAGWLARERLLDALVLKVNPVLFGDGVPFLGSHEAQLVTRGFESYRSGVYLAHYDFAEASAPTVSINL